MAVDILGAMYLGGVVAVEMELGVMQLAPGSRDAARHNRAGNDI